MTLGVYGLVAPAPARVAVTGVAGERLRVVTVGSVSAIVGDLRRAPRATEANLRKYNRVMQALARGNPALLPVRFATEFRDLDELTLVLGSRQSAFRRLLRHVRNRAQITIRIAVAGSADRQSSVGRLLPGLPRDPDHTRTTTGASYLKGLAAQAARAREVPGFDPVRAAVRRWVKDERVERQSTVASVYHLIPRTSVDAYRAALDRATQKTDLRMRVSGPFPPYAFTNF